MGCAFSRRVRRDDERDDERDAPSFAEYANPSGGLGGFGFVERMAKGYDSGEIGVRIDGKVVATKGPEMSSFLGRASIVGLEKAVGVLDTLGSSMSNLNYNSGFASGIAPRGNKISILAFEVANTIAKAANLMHSLSEENIQFLKKEILPSEGVRHLVSTDTKELLRIAASDKREEFHVFSGEVARFGDLCKDPEWHNLNRYFQKLDSDPTPQEKLREEAETTMQQLINLNQHTSELYHELHSLDRFDQDYKRKLEEEESLPTSRRDEGLAMLNSELKHQRKLVKNLKKKSLWSRNLEEVVEKLVDVVVYLHKKISDAFDLTDVSLVDCGPVRNPKTLGISGLALHYANIVHQIENIVSRPISIPPNTRDTLYHGLPIGVKAALRSRLQSFLIKELTVPHIKAEMQKILHWLAPMAENTIKAHQGFGWVGEWANMGTEVSKKPAQHQNVVRIQTLYHADKEKVDEYILQLVVWLHHLVEQVKSKGFGFNSYKPINYKPRKTLLGSPETKKDASQVHSGEPTVLTLSQEEREMLQSVSYQRLVLGRTRSQGYLTNKEKKRRNCRLSRSSNSSPDKEYGTSLECQFERTRFLDTLDGLEVLDSFPAVSLYT